MTNAERFLGMVLGGGYCEDREFFDLAHQIVIDPDESFENKIIALRHVDEVMGCDGEYTQAAVDEYIAQTIGIEHELNPHSPMAI